MGGSSTSSQKSHHTTEKDRHGGAQTPDVTHIHNPGVAHEESDVNVRGIAKFVIALAIGSIVTFVLMRVMFNYLESRELAAQAEQPASPLAKQKSPEERLPPEPRLQLAPGHEIHPLKDMEKAHDEWKAQLNGYGWVDQNVGTVRIPIEQAKRVLLEKGLLQARQPQQGQGTGGQNATGQPAQQSSGTEQVPTSPSSGQKTDTRGH